MWVVKLGGSLDLAGTLADWANALDDSGQPLIICAGGGPFADRVRAAQGRWPINDTTAHRMAILAMEQTAHLLCGLCPRLIPATVTAALDAAPSGRRALIWFPAAELVYATDIAHTWAVTSDTLAAMLARRINAEGLVALVKSAPLAQGPAPVGELQRAGILDEAFAEHGRRCGCPVWLLCGRDSGEFNRLLRGEVDTQVLFGAAPA